MERAILALNIPAICGEKEYPQDSLKDKYIEWSNKYYCKYECELSARQFYEIRESFANKGTCNSIDNKKIHYYTEEISTSGVHTTTYYEVNEYEIHISSFCYKMVKAAKNYYSENKEKFDESDNVNFTNPYATPKYNFKKIEYDDIILNKSIFK